MYPLPPSYMSCFTRKRCHNHQHLVNKKQLRQQRSSINTRYSRERMLLPRDDDDEEGGDASLLYHGAEEYYLPSLDDAHCK